MSRNSIAVAALAAAFAAGGAQANLLADGSFEAVPLAGGNFGNLLENYAPGPIGPSWTVGGNNVLAFDGTYTEPGLNFVVQHGTKAVDLTGAGYEGPITLSQTVNLAAGAYLLSFYLGDISQIPNYTLTSSVNVLVNNVQQGLTFANATGTGTVSWVQFLVPFTSLGGATTVTFSTTGLVLDNFTGIDNAVLTAVPEAGTWLMMMAGLAAVGFAAKRRAGV